MATATAPAGGELESSADSFVYRQRRRAELEQRDGSIAVGAVNDAPVAVATTSTNEDVTLTVAAPGALGNDTDADGDALSASVVPAGARHADAERGRLQLHAGGQLQRRRQLQLPGERRHAHVERGDRVDLGRRGQRRAGGGQRQLLDAGRHGVDGVGAGRPRQ
jgi:hypothetical protein